MQKNFFYFRDSDSFVKKIQSKRIKKNFLLINLFSSFSFHHQKNSDIRTFFQKETNSTVYYLESLKKEIDKNFLIELGFFGFYNNLILYKKKGEQTFHKKSFCKPLNVQDAVSFKKGKKGEIFGRVERLKNDFAYILFSKKKANIPMDKNNGGKEKFPNPKYFLKKIKKNKLSPSFFLKKEFYINLKKNSQKLFQEGSGFLTFSPRLQDIVTLKPKKIINLVSGFSGDQINLLALDGSIQSLHVKEFLNRCEKDSPESTKGFDYKQNIIFAGDYCEFLIEKNENKTIFQVLFVQKNFLFLKRIANNILQDSKFIACKSQDVKIVEKNHYKRRIKVIDSISELKINKGVFKGYQGRVLKIDKDNIETELMATGKIIKIPIERVSFEKKKFSIKKIEKKKGKFI